jgi:hypothetical protein
VSSNRVPDWLQPGPITPPPLLPTPEEIRETCGDGPEAAMVEAAVDILRTSATGSTGPVRPGEETTT